jgi:hypothetical protein
MAKRYASRKSKRSHRSHSRKAHRRTRRQRQQRKQGGMAPITYSLSGSWPSRMSLGQGGDYSQYHAGQHGGSAPYPVAVSGSPLITDAMVGPSMTGGIDKAIADVRSLRDEGPPVVQSGAGHRRRTHSRRARKTKGKRKSSRRQQRKRGGGGMPSLGFMGINGPSMLLSSKSQYDSAGLNPDYRGAAIEYKVAEARDKV